MNAITPFLFDAGRVRVVLIGGEPHFVAKDVCERLGYADHINAIKQHCRGVVIHHPIADALGRQQMARVLSEADLMRLIVASKLPAAEEFERVVFEEILPTIRRTGSYGAAGGDLDLDDPSLLHGLILKHTAQNIQLRHQVSVMAPQVATLHLIARQEGEFSLRDCAKTLSMSPKIFNSWLIEMGWIYRDAADDLRPYQPKIDAGYLKLRRSEKTLLSGQVRAISQTLVTAKGQVKLGHLLSLKQQ
jgi:prophage antirepressor-like protein